jgi:predicted O-linked N-acetylglucosamine transferase (SPINDLY family)
MMPLESARELHQRGELAQAIEGYERLVEANPGRAEVWHLKGLAEQQAGRLEAALDSARRAIEAGGEQPPFLLLQGHVLHDRGDLESAENSFARLAALRPEWAPGHVALGVVRMDRGRHADAEKAFRAAVAADPRHPRAWQNLGAALRELGRDEDAVRAFERAISIDTSYALAHLSLARLHARRDDARALAHAEAAARSDPRLAEAWLLAGDIHRRRFDFDKALGAFASAVAAAPGEIRAAIAKAELLAEVGQIEQGREEFTAAAARFPSSFKAAIGSRLLLPRVYEDRAHLERSRAAYAEGLESLHGNVDRFRAPRPEMALADARWVNFYLAYQGGDDRVLQERYGALVRSVLEPQMPRFFAPRAKPSQERDRIRVGFLSHFFFNCVVGRYFSSWITHLDRGRFETVVYYTNDWMAEDTKVIAAAAGRFRHLAGRPLTAIAEQVIADDLDVLVYPELGMHPETFALAALRLAPVQCAGWGHPVTTGQPEIDWFISCEGMEPQGAEGHYSERLVKLPGLGTRYAMPVADASGSRADFGIPDAATAYFVPQSLFKIHPENDELIAGVLARDPAGVAVMFPSRQQSFNRVFSARLARSLASRGLDPEERIRFLKFVPHGTYLRVNQLCDVMLDSLHWSGGNTSLDAIASGLPLVTLPGAYMRGRQSAAMLRGMGLEELIASSPRDYVEKAVRLGSDREARREISRRIAEQRGALFERDEPVRALEDFLGRVGAAQS